MNKEHLHSEGRPYTKEEFVMKIKTDKVFTERFGNLGKIYGYQWRNWNDEIDQIQNLINDLKNNPDSRRLMVTAWNPSEIADAVLPPCHYGFQCWTKELTYEERYRIWFSNNFETGFEYDNEAEVDFDDPHWIKTPKRSLSLKWIQRSCDFPLGVPVNIASYGLLLEILAKEVNMVPDELIGSFGDSHIYLNQIEGVKEQIERTSFDLPNLNIKLHFENIPSFVPENWLVSDFVIENYESHPKIYFPLSN